MLTNLINILFLITLAQNSEPQIRSLKNMTVTQGIYTDRIIIEWEKVESISYTVMRSQFKTGEFTPVAQTADTKYEDVTVEKGVKYWYKVLPSPEIEADEEIFITSEEYNIFPEPVFSTSEVKAEIKETEIKTDSGNLSEQIFCYSGYTSIENYAGVKLSDLLKLKKVKLKIPSHAEDKKKQQRYLEYLKQYYMHPVKLSLFMTMAGPYFDKGELKILTDCDSFEIKGDLGQVVFYNFNYSYMVIFESTKFLRILTESNDTELAEILLKNSEFYCIPGATAFIIDKTGITRLVNTYDAVGLSTGYLKNDSEWRSRTIMLATSRSDLKEKLKNASQKGNE